MVLWMLASALEVGRTAQLLPGILTLKMSAAICFFVQSLELQHSSGQAVVLGLRLLYKMMDACSAMPKGATGP